MFKELLMQLKTSFLVLIFFTLLTGLLYPLAVTSVAQLLFPWKANGSLLQHQGQLLGSELIGQPFSSAHYFWSRPSATGEHPYNGLSSSGSNAGPRNPTYLATIKARIEQLKQTDPNHSPLIPIDLITASGSGLDPDISPLAAYYQAARIAQARQIPLETVYELIEEHIQRRSLGFLGEPRINVLELNLALDHWVAEHA